MHYIIFDLEATCWSGNPMGRQQETIEIGAVKLDEFGQEIDTYNEFIKPIIHPNLSAFCSELTSIDQKDVDSALTFEKVIDRYIDWINPEEHPYLLCSWGDFDKKQLLRDCQYHDIDTEWLEPYINLKRQYQEIQRLPKARGLKSTVIKEGFEFEGVHHRGIYDAINLAQIFVKYLDSWRY